MGLMQLWLDGKVMDAGWVQLQLTSDFFTLWQYHWIHKMLYPLQESASDLSVVHKEITKKKFWSSGWDGLIVLAVGLQWSWWKVSEDDTQGTLDEWTRLVQNMTRILEMVLEKQKKYVSS